MHRSVEEEELDRGLGGGKEALVAGKGLEEDLESGSGGEEVGGGGLFGVGAVSEVAETETEVETEELGTGQAQ